MSLTKQEIDYLFEFVRKKNIHFYDLQLEIVDHLAMLIEEKMEEDNVLTVQTALPIVYLKFGIFGFAHIVQQKQRALEKASNLNFWQMFKIQFNWPNLLRSVCLFAVTYSAFTILQLKVCAYLILVLVIIGVSYTVLNTLRIKKLKKQLLFLNTLPFANIGFSLAVQITINMCFNNMYSVIELQQWQIFLYSTIIFLTVMGSIALKNVNDNLWLQAKQHYPAAFV